METKELAIGYCRVSTKKQEKKGLSLEAQEDNIRNWVKENGYDLVRVFKVQESARAGERKHLFGAFRYCIENGIKLILITDSDRWTRNRKIDMDAREFMEKNGLSVYLIRDDRHIMEFKSAAQTLGHNVKVDVDQYVSDAIREKVLTAVKKKLEKGEFPGLPPQGYESVKKTDVRPHTIIQTEDAPKVKRLLETFNSGKLTIRQAISFAKDISLKPSRMDAFSKGQMAKLIKNKFYFGEFEWGHSEKDDEEPMVYKNKTEGFEPIITKEIWQRNQAILKKRQTNFRGKGECFRYNNLLTCGKCGRLIYGNKFDHEMNWKTKKGTTTKKYNYEPRYLCTKGTWFTTDGHNPIPVEWVDKEMLTIKENHEVTTYYDVPIKNKKGEIVDYEVVSCEKAGLKEGTKVEARRCDMPVFKESELEQMFLDEISIIKFNKKHWTEIKRSLFKDETKEFLDYEIRSLRSEMTKNESKLDEMYEDYRKGVVDEEFFKSRSEKIRERQAEVKERLVELEQERELFDERIGKAVEILDGLKDWEKIFKQADGEKRNHLLRLLTIKISTNYSKREIRGKIYETKNLHLTLTPEVRELFEIGILELAEKYKDEIELFLVGDYSDYGFSSPKLRYA